MVKKSKNLEKSIKKNFKKKKQKKVQKKKAIFLVLPIEEISLGPELSSPARFRIQGGPLSVTQ